MRLGYARVSTGEQSLESQCQRLSAAGCEKLFEEKISGAARNRPKLEKLIEQLRKGDVLVVTRLDRLARSLREARDIVDELTVWSMPWYAVWALIVALTVQVMPCS